MPATLLNAPARPLLTRSVILVLSIVLLAVGLLAFVIGGSATRHGSAGAGPPCVHAGGPLNADAPMREIHPNPSTKRQGTHADSARDSG